MTALLDVAFVLAGVLVLGFGIGFGAVVGIFAGSRWFGPIRVDRAKQVIHQYWHDGPPPGDVL